MVTSSVRDPGRRGVLRVSDAEATALATLSDDAATVDVLQRARVSRNMAFLSEVLRRLADGPARRIAMAGFDTLTVVQERNPAAAQEVLRHPRFGAWAATCATGAAADADSDWAATHLACFAAAAAIRSGIEFDLELPQVGDCVVLPGLGCWVGPAARTAQIHSAGHEIPDVEDRHWMPLRWLTSQRPNGIVRVEFDDLPPTPWAWPDIAPADSHTRWSRWSALEFHRWQELFDEAMRLLAGVVPELFGPLVRGMHAILPRSRRTSSFVTSTLVDSFGAAAMVLPTDAVRAASGLLHEFQHSKLSALMEVRPLVAQEGPADLPSPWRAEPRPASALLHGVYAHLAVARFVGRLPVRDTTGEADAVRAATLTGCATLLHSQRLTAAGRRFVMSIQRTAELDGRRRWLTGRK